MNIKIMPANKTLEDRILKAVAADLKSKLTEALFYQGYTCGKGPLPSESLCKFLDGYTKEVLDAQRDYLSEQIIDRVANRIYNNKPFMERVAANILAQKATISIALEV